MLADFRGKLVKIIKDSGDEFEDYSTHLKYDKFYCIWAMK